MKISRGKCSDMSDAPYAPPAPVIKKREQKGQHFPKPSCCVMPPQSHGT